MLNKPLTCYKQRIVFKYSTFFILCKAFNKTQTKFSIIDFNFFFKHKTRTDPQQMKEKNFDKV